MTVLLQISAFLAELVALGVLIGGLVALARSRHRLPARAISLARAGFVVLLVEVVVALAWPLLFSFAAEATSTSDFLALSFASTLALNVLFCIGVALLIAGFLATRQVPAVEPPVSAWAGPWSVPQQPAPGVPGVEIPAPDGPVDR